MKPRFWTLGLDKNDRARVNRGDSATQGKFRFDTDLEPMTAREKLIARSDFDSDRKFRGNFVPDKDGALARSVSFIISEHGGRLNQWEREFLFSLDKWLKEKHGLTTKQHTTLMRLIDKWCY